MRSISFYTGRSARQNVEEAIDAAIQYDEYHALLSLTIERAYERAELVDNGTLTGRLAGVPFIAKDNFLTLGGTTTAASTILENFEAPLQATAIDRLEAEGAICIGKSNLDSFAHGSSTENSAFGATKNAVDPTKVAGGSSGGSAVAVALGIVPFALGTDTGGSIRQPASFNGVVGVKPTYGMISRFGVVAMASSTDVIGCFATTVADAQIVTDIMAGKDDKDMTTLEDYFVPQPELKQPLKVGVIGDFMSNDTDSGVRNRVNEYVSALQAKGHSVETVEIPLIKYSLAMYYIVVPAEIASNLARYDGVRYGVRTKDASSIEQLYGVSRDRGFVAESKRRIMIGNYVLSSGYFDAYYLKAQKARRLLINQFNELFNSLDILISPVVPTVAFGLGTNTDDPIKMYLSDAMTVGISLAGLPALSVPAGTSDDLPVGVQLIAKQKDEAKLFAIAKSMETNR